MSPFLSVLVVRVPDFRETLTPCQTGDTAESTSPALRCKLCITVIISTVADTVLRFATPSTHNFRIAFAITLMIIPFALLTLSTIFPTARMKFLDCILRRQFMSMDAMSFLRPANIGRKWVQVGFRISHFSRPTTCQTSNFSPIHIPILGRHRVTVLALFSHLPSLTRRESEVNSC